MVKMRSSQGKTLAMIALEEGKHACLLVALQNGANNIETDLVGNTLQHKAAKKGDAVAVTSA